MSNLYQYLTENYKENEPFFLSDIQIDGMTGNNIRQQLKKLTDAEKVKRLTRVSIIFPRKVFSNLVQNLHWKKFWNINICVTTTDGAVTSVDYYFSTKWDLLHRFLCNMKSYQTRQPMNTGKLLWQSPVSSSENLKFL